MPTRGSIPSAPGTVSNTNYTVQWYFGTLTVTPATLIVQPANQTITYGGSLVQGNAAFNLGGTYAGGWAPNDNNDTWIVQPTIMATSLHAGTSILYVTAAQVSPDYVLQYGTAILTVKPAALTIISMNQPNITYGQAVAQPTLANYSPDGITGVWLAVGWAGTDTAAALTKLPTIAPASIHVGTRSLVISGAVDPDYTIGYAYGSVTITAAPLILTADTKTKVYGAALPTLTASAPAKGQPGAFQYNDTLASLPTQPTILTTATAASAVGSYPITISGPVSDGDYTVTYVNGLSTEVLNVTPATLIVTAMRQQIIYGSPLTQPTVANYSPDGITGVWLAVGWQNGDTAASLTTLPTVSTTDIHVGTYTNGITIAGAVDPNYTFNYVAGNLTITPTTAALTITALAQQITYGQALTQPTIADYGTVWTASGFLPGDSITTLTALPTVFTVDKHVQATPYVGGITIAGAIDSDYSNITYVYGNLTITPANLKIIAKRS